jgi:hypothetical protein
MMNYLKMRTVDQVGDRNENIIENPCRPESHQYDGEREKIQHAFTKECLDKSAVWPTVASANRERLPNSHQRDNSIEKERGNLNSVGMGTTKTLEDVQRILGHMLMVSIKFTAGRVDTPRRWAE